MEGVNSAECLATWWIPQFLEFVPEEVTKRYVGGDYSNIIINLGSRTTKPLLKGLSRM